MVLARRRREWPPDVSPLPRPHSDDVVGVGRGGFVSDDIAAAKAQHMVLAGTAVLIEPDHVQGKGRRIEEGDPVARHGVDDVPTPMRGEGDEEETVEGSMDRDLGLMDGVAVVLHPVEVDKVVVDDGGSVTTLQVVLVDEVVLVAGEPQDGAQLAGAEVEGLDAVVAEVDVAVGAGDAVEAEERLRRLRAVEEGEEGPVAQLAVPRLADRAHAEDPLGRQPDEERLEDLEGGVADEGRGDAWFRFRHSLLRTLRPRRELVGATGRWCVVGRDCYCSSPTAPAASGSILPAKCKRGGGN